MNKRIGLFALSALLLSSVSARSASDAQPARNAANWAQIIATHRLPRFEQFSVPLYRGPVGRLDLNSNPEAIGFRTRLREGARQPINFAGHYQLVEWGYGTGVAAGAIIDVLTGRVTFLPTIDGSDILNVRVPDAFPYDDQVNYHTNSRLIVLAGQLDSLGPVGIHFFVMTPSGLERILTIPYSAPEDPPTPDAGANDHMDPPGIPYSQYMNQGKLTPEPPNQAPNFPSAIPKSKTPGSTWSTVTPKCPDCY